MKCSFVCGWSNQLQGVSRPPCPKSRKKNKKMEESEKTFLGRVRVRFPQNEGHEKTRKKKPRKNNEQTTRLE